MPRFIKNLTKSSGSKGTFMPFKMSSIARTFGTMLLGGMGGFVAFLLLRSAVPASVPTADPAMELDPYSGNPFSGRLTDAVNFDNVKLEDALSSLGASEHIKLVCEWKSLEQCGVRPDARISLHVKNGRIGDVLDQICFVASGSNGELGWFEHDGVITIAAEMDIEKFEPVIERLYDVRPLLIDAQQFSLRFPTSSPKPMSNIFFSQSPVVPGTTPTEPDGEKATDFIKFITDNVSANTWIANGGEIGQITYAGNGRILVRQTEAAHSKIQRLLDLLRREK